MLGMPEIVIILLVVVVLLFGAKKIPELARSMGRAKAEFERGKMEIEKEINEEYKADTQKKEDSKVVKAAKELSIDTQGKTEEELKKEIAAKVADSP